MRKDVKAGMALSLVVVVVAGWYYTQDSDQPNSIPLGEGGSAQAPETAVQDSAAATEQRPSTRTSTGDARRQSTRSTPRSRAGTESSQARRSVATRQKSTATPGPVSLRANRSQPSPEVGTKVATAPSNRAATACRSSPR